MTSSMVPAVILAGGQAMRMGGVDKTLLTLGDRRIVDHIMDGLIPQVGRLAINANGDVARFAGLGLPVLPDDMLGFPGPLAGVLTAMEWAYSQGYSVVLTVAGDTPFFPDDLVAGLTSHAGAQGICIAAEHTPDGSLSAHPTFGLWRVSFRDRLRHDLLAGQRRMLQWAEDQGATLAPFSASPLAFFNINTNEDLLEAARRMASDQKGRA